MMMTCGEICVSYKQAKNQKEQVSILAQLNECKETDIIEILKSQKAWASEDDTLGAIIRKLRTKKGLTQKQVAEMAGINYSTLCYFERGRSPGAKKTIAGIKKAIEMLRKEC